ALHLERVAGHAFADVADDAGWPMAISLLAETAALVGDRRAAAPLAEILSPFAADGTLMMTGGVVLGPASRLLALVHTVTGVDDVDRCFASAIDEADRLESPIWRARCRLDWAAWSRARGGDDRAAMLIAEADAVIGDRDLPAVRRQLAELRA